MLEILKEIFDAENRIVLKHRSHGEFCCKVTTILYAVIIVLYVLDPIDIIPEAIIRPSPFAYIDDIIVALVLGYYIYKDIGEVIFKNVENRIQPESIPENNRTGSKDNIPLDLNIREDAINNDAPAISDDIDSVSSESIGTDISSIGDIADSNSSVPVSSGFDDIAECFPGFFSDEPTSDDGETHRESGPVDN